MGYMTDGLTFNTLRGANRARLPQFKNRRGEPAHSEPDGSDWKLSAWCNAVTGELGELANLIKKIERGDMTLDEARISTFWHSVAASISARPRWTSSTA